MFSLSPFAPENLSSRDGFGRPVPRQAAHSKFSVRLNLVRTHGIPPAFRDGVHICGKPPPGQTPEFIGSREGVPMAFTAEIPPAQGQ